MTNLKRIRKQRGMEQAELARLSGVSLRSIQMWEQGYRSINGGAVHKVLKVADALNVDVRELLEKQG